MKVNMNYSIIKSNQDFLDLIIIGSTKEIIKCEIKIIIKTLEGIPMISLIEGRYKGKLLELPATNFTITKRIKLPKYLAKGDYYVDIILHQPLTQDYFQAPLAAQIHIDGGFNQYAHPINLKDEGFCGLESDTCVEFI